MQFDIVKNGKFTIIKPLTSELGLSEASSFQAKVTEVLNEGNRLVLLDLSEVKEIDSSGVSALIHLSLFFHSYPEAKLACFQINPSVKRVLHVTHAENLLPLFENEQAAIDNINPLLSNHKIFLYYGPSAEMLTLLGKKAEGKAKITLCPSFADLKAQSKNVQLSGVFVEEAVLKPEELEQLIKLTGERQVALVALLQPPMTMERITKLKEKGSNIWAVSIPLQQEEADFIISELAKESDSEHEGEPTLPLSDKLLKKYAETLPIKLAELEILIEKALKNPSKETFEPLKFEVHKLSGSAGSYGYVKAGNNCKELEIFLNDSIEKNSFIVDAVKLQDYFRKIKFFFSVSTKIDLSKKNQALQQVQEGTAFLVSPDNGIVSLFQKAGNSLLNAIVYEKTPEAALESLKRQEYKPELFLLEKNFPDSKMDGFSLIAAIKSNFSTQSMKFGLIVDQDNLDDNLKASDLGVSMILKKPLSLTRVEDLLAKIITKKASGVYRILVIDDDANIREFIKDSLESPQINVFALSDETKILETLYSYQPNLLLLDINLPKYNGWTLLKTLRMDLRYKDLKIVMITSIIPENAAEHHDKFDDIWIKPLTKEHLQKEISGFIEKTLFDNDAFHSIFLNQNAFKKELQKEVSYHPQNPGKLVILGSSDFKTISTENLGAKKEYLIACENLINQNFLGDVLKGSLGEGIFALYFSNYTVEELEHLIDKFINDTEYRIMLENKQAAYNTFSAVITDILNAEHSQGVLDFAVNYFEKNVILPSQKLTVAYK